MANSILTKTEPRKTR